MTNDTTAPAAPAAIAAWLRARADELDPPNRIRTRPQTAVARGVEHQAVPRERRWRVVDWFPAGGLTQSFGTPELARKVAEARIRERYGNHEICWSLRFETAPGVFGYVEWVLGPRTGPVDDSTWTWTSTCAGTPSGVVIIDEPVPDEEN